MRILFCNIVYPTAADGRIVGGAEVSTKALAEAFRDEGHEVVVFRGAAKPSLEGEESVNGIRVVSRVIRNSYWPFDGRHHSAAQKARWYAIDALPRAPEGFSSLLTELRPDVIYTANLIGLTWGIWREARLRNIPVVHILRDYYTICRNSARFFRGQNCIHTCANCRLMTMPRRLASTDVNAVVGISHFILDTHLREGAFSRTEFRAVIPNISAPVAAASPQRIKAFFGYIGRISPEKGVEALVSALRLLPPSADLLIAGEIAEATKRELVSLAGRPIVFPGFITPAEFNSSVRVVVVPSLWGEPFSRAVIEAFSYGRPVVASNRGGLPDTVGNTGAGILYSPEVDGSLVQAMLQYFQDPALEAESGLAARARADDFSAARVVTMHRDLLAKILAS
jgi:glycosyltransferase involved in cell wall biosynthesis